MYYALGSNVVKLTKVMSEFTLDTMDGGKKYGVPGDYLATNMKGDRFIIKQEDIEYYVPVEVKHAAKRHRSPFEEQYVEAYAKGTFELGQNEEQSFIDNNTYEQLEERLKSNKPL